MIVENKETHNLHPSLCVPVAAKTIADLARYVGQIVDRCPREQWCILEFKPLAAPNELGVWKHPRSRLLTASRQCWVRVAYRAYRRAYQDCFPDLDLRDYVIDHIHNRRLAKALEYGYIRLMHVSRGVNSSSGRGEEFDVITYKNPAGLKRFTESPHRIAYANPADLLKMLDIKVGAFPLNNLRDHLHLFYG